MYSTIYIKLRNKQNNPCITWGYIHYGTPKYIWQPRSLDQNSVRFWEWEGDEGRVEIHWGLQQNCNDLLQICRDVGQTWEHGTNFTDWSLFF